MWDGVWEWLSKFSNVISVLSLIPIVLTWLLVRKAERDRRLTLKAQREKKSDCPCVLLIDIGTGPDRIKPQVTGQIQRNPQLAELRAVPEERFREVNIERNISPDDLEPLILEVRKELTSLYDLGMDRLHLIVRGPVLVGAMVGAVLANKLQVILYHKNNETHQYECWGPLQRQIN